MKLYTKVLERCFNCPERSYRDTEHGCATYDWCDKYRKEIPYNTQTFPSWYKLEDVK